MKSAEILRNVKVSELIGWNLKESERKKLFVNLMEEFGGLKSSQEKF